MRHAFSSQPTPIMMLRRALVFGSFVTGALLCSCAAASDITAAEPLVGGAPIAVSLESATGVPLSNLPRLDIAATAAQVSVTWEVESGSCVIAQASALRAGNIIEIRLQRGGNPLANCVAMRVGYRYIARVAGLEQGQYEVRLVDTFADLAPQEIGRRSVSVGAVYIVN